MPPVFYKPPLPINIKAPKGRIVPLESPQIKMGKCLVALAPHRIRSTALNNLRMALKRYLGKKKEYFVHHHATYPITKKPDGVKMGQGKGSIKDHVARIPAGSIIAQLPQISPFCTQSSIFSALRRVSSHLTMSCQVRSQRNNFPSDGIDKLIDIKKRMEADRMLEWRKRQF